VTLENKWDLIWPLACAVSAAIERFDRSTEVRDATTLMHMARQLKKAVDHVSPDPCIGGDKSCPCHDGDACHYKDLPGSPAMPLPGYSPLEPK
jgi:hypothetical protein